MLDTLAVENYRSLRRLIVPLRSCTVVTGPNGSGKSSLYRALRLLADSAIAGFTVHAARMAAALERNPVLVTALNPVIGYERGAAIAKQALVEGRSVREVAAGVTGLSEAELAPLLDPLALTRGGAKGAPGGG